MSTLSPSSGALGMGWSLAKSFWSAVTLPRLAARFPLEGLTWSRRCCPKDESRLESVGVKISAFSLPFMLCPLIKSLPAEKL